jgi:tetratricopeptide (TPR) repeat protein
LRLHRIGLIFGCALLASFAHAINGVLIVQEMVRPDRVGDPNVAIANSMAEAVEKEGLYAPVVWSLTDPIFRAAMAEGLRADPEKVPDLDQAQAVAKRLKLEYVLYVRAYQFGNSVMGRAMLFKGGKLIWKDPEKGTELMDPDQKLEATQTTNKKGQVTKTIPKPATIQTDDRPMSVMGPGGLLLEDSALSLVRTWVSLMKGGPLKGQAIQPKILTPDPLPGTKTNVPSEGFIPPVKDKVDNKQLFADLDAMIRGGQTIPGILMIRDAVDAEPQDVDRRIALVRTLLLVGQAELAAKEARRAAELIPERAELRAMAARAWMQAGREDEAMADLNEAVARDPNSVDTRMLLAEVNLAKLRPAQAMEHLDAILKEKPTADAWFKKALCHTLLGNKDGVAEDLAKAKEAGLSSNSQDQASRYNLTLDTLDKAIMQMGTDLRAAMNQAQVQRTAPEVKQSFNLANSQIGAWTAFLGGAGAPGLHRASHDQRVLALNLLTQSLGDFGTYLASNDMDMLADSRINLGEALKQYTTAQASYQKEIGGIAKNVGSK